MVNLVTKNISTLVSFVYSKISAWWNCPRGILKMLYSWCENILEPLKSLQAELNTSAVWKAWAFFLLLNSNAVLSRMRQIFVFSIGSFPVYRLVVFLVLGWTAFGGRCRLPVPELRYSQLKKIREKRIERVFAFESGRRGIG